MITNQKPGLRLLVLSLTVAMPLWLHAQQNSAVPAGTLTFDDSTNNYVELGNTSKNLYQLTITCWVKTTQKSSDGTMIVNKFSDKENNGYALVNQNGHIVGGYVKDANNTVVDVQHGALLDGGDIADGSWHHIAMVIDDNGGRLYVDGSLKSSRSWTGTPGASTNANNIILGTNQNQNKFFDGSLDELQIWSRALCIDEIKHSMDSGLYVTPTYKPAGLEEYYTFYNGYVNADNSGDSTLNDQSGNRHNGALHNFRLKGSISNWTADKITATGHQYTAPQIALNSSGTLTLTSSEEDFGQTNGNSVSKTYTIYNTGSADLTISAIRITGDNASDFSVTTSPSSTIAGSGNSSFSITFSPASAGVKNATVSIYNNSCANSTVSFNITGEKTNGAGALNFDGSNDYVSISNSSSLNNYVSTGAITIEFWVNPYQTSKQDYISKRSGANNDGFAIEVDGGRVYHYFNTNNGWNAAVTTYSNNTWQHVAVTAKIGDSIKVYVNGVEKSSSKLYGTAFTSSSAEMDLMRDIFYRGYYLQGSLDEVRIWSRALCQSEIQATMNCQLSGTQDGLEAYYQFNEGVINTNNSSVTTLRDESGNGNNGTLNNFALSGSTSNWITGKITTTCTPYTAPKIALNSSGTLTLMSSEKNFGQSNGSSVSKTYTIYNTGTADLTISNIKITGASASDFSVTTSASSTIAGSGNSSFSITFSPASTGVKNATVTIHNNTCDNNPVSFDITGENLCTSPQFSSNPGTINLNTSLNSCTTTAKYSVSASGSPNYTYSFSGATSGAGSGTGSGSSLNKGTTHIWVKASNVCGKDSISFDVVVTDNAAPRVVTQDVTVYLDANGAATVSASDIDNGSSDNCGISTMSLDKKSFSCSDLGTNTVTLTATDGSGNTGTGTATVTVKDTIKPVVKTQDITVTLNTSGNVTIQTSDVDNGSYDNCSLTLALDKSSFSCSDVGTQIVTLSGTDASGNTTYTTAKVTVKSTLSASATTTASTVYYGYSPMASATLKATGSGGSGSYTYKWNTGETTQSISVSPTTSTSYTVVVTDGNGCTTDAKVTVDVMDVRCGKKLDKVAVCHNGNSICIDASAVAAHLKNHKDDALGECMGKNSGYFEVPEEVQLNVFPNPFATNATIQFSVPADQPTVVEVYDLRGMKIATLFSGVAENGNLYSFTFNGDKLAGGMYLVRLISNNETKLLRMDLVK